MRSCTLRLTLNHEQPSKPFSIPLVQSAEKDKTWRTMLENVSSGVCRSTQKAKAAFKAGHTLKESSRLDQLGAMVRMLEEHECDFVQALGKTYISHTLRQ
ncbi:hypothetical protein WMY93_004991 [Mugilogobius chulae]|uniref:Uncharacterized protein n=1 Tax=Mugilogobius chulae TaxID=88201 RepID=A0AAW0PW11_9GOBI